MSNSKVVETSSGHEKIQAKNAGTSAGVMSGKKVKVDVRDDWEDDDDDEDNNLPAIEAHNKRIWEEANARESLPMPSVILSRGSTTSNTSSSLPLNQPPTMRILKRPSQATSPLTNADNTIGDTIQDREARYMAARERIFGSTNEGGSVTGPKKKEGPTFLGKQSTSPSSSGASQIVRKPHGPISIDDSASSPQNKGFGDRRHNRPKIGSFPSSPKSPNDTPL